MPDRDDTALATPPSPSAARGGVGTTYLLTMVYYPLRMRVEQTFKAHGVTGLQYSILKVVSNNERLSSADLSRYFYVSPQNMGQLLSGLESRGLIGRDEDESNRRILRISMTEEGRRLVSMGDAEMAKLEAEVYRDFSPEDLEHFRGMLKRVTKSIRPVKPG